MVMPLMRPLVTLLPLLLIYTTSIYVYGWVPGFHHFHGFRRSRTCRSTVFLRDRLSDDNVSTLTTKLERLVALAEAEQDIACLSLLYSRLNEIQINKTYTGTSAIAGRGLFAAADCKQGDLLTCYPGDALVIIPDDGSDWTILWGDHVPEPPDKLHDDMLGYLLHAKDDVGVLALADLDCHNTAYLGHFANDGVSEAPKYESQLSAYVLESQTLANAMHRDVCNGAHMMTIAMHDIRAHEEIFVSYGPEYWMEQPTFLGDDELDTDSPSGGMGFG